jgi:hypothetical protein
MVVMVGASANVDQGKVGKAEQAASKVASR